MNEGEARAQYSKEVWNAHESMYKPGTEEYQRYWHEQADSLGIPPEHREHPFNKKVIDLYIRMHMLQHDIAITSSHGRWHGDLIIDDSEEVRGSEDDPTLQLVERRLRIADQFVRAAMRVVEGLGSLVDGKQHGTVNPRGLLGNLADDFYPLGYDLYVGEREPKPTSDDVERVREQNQTLYLNPGSTEN